MTGSIVQQSQKHVTCSRSAPVCVRKARRPEGILDGLWPGDLVDSCGDSRQRKSKAQFGAKANVMAAEGFLSARQRSGVRENKVGGTGWFRQASARRACAEWLRA